MSAVIGSVTTGMTPGSCPYCGSYWHSGMCPRLEAIEYHPNGAVKSIKLREMHGASCGCHSRTTDPAVTFTVRPNPLLGPSSLEPVIAEGPQPPTKENLA